MYVPYEQLSYDRPLRRWCHCANRSVIEPSDPGPDTESLKEIKYTEKKGQIEGDRRRNKIKTKFLNKTNIKKFDQIKTISESSFQ